MKVARLLREALERVVPTDVASAILFDALGDTGVPDPTREAMIPFLEGPLRDAIVRRVGTRDASGLLDLVRMPIETSMRSGRQRRDDTPTRHVAPMANQVRAVVFDDGTGLGRRLLASFSSEQLVVEVVRDENELTARGAAMVIVDAITMEGTQPMAIAKACAWFEPSTLRIVHGAETAFGSKMLQAFGATHQNAIPVRRDHGPLPLIELVRSRMS